MKLMTYNLQHEYFNDQHIKINSFKYLPNPFNIDVNVPRVVMTMLSLLIMSNQDALYKAMRDHVDMLYFPKPCVLRLKAIFVDSNVERFLFPHIFK